MESEDDSKRVGRVESVENADDSKKSWKSRICGECRRFENELE